MGYVARCQRQTEIGPWGQLWFNRNTQPQH